MKHADVFALFAGFALAACAPATDQRLDLEKAGTDDLIATVTGDDAEMNAAIAHAQRTLPDFEKRLAAPPAAQSEIKLKAKFDYGDNNGEHMWIKGITVVDGGYRGTLVSTPEYVDSLVAGQSVFVRREQVSDWLAVDDGVLVAGYTMRVIRKRMSPDEQQQFDAMVGYRMVDLAEVNRVRNQE